MQKTPRYCEVGVRAKTDGPKEDPQDKPAPVRIAEQLLPHK